MSNEDGNAGMIFFENQYGSLSLIPVTDFCTSSQLTYENHSNEVDGALVDANMAKQISLIAPVKRVRLRFLEQHRFDKGYITLLKKNDEGCICKVERLTTSSVFEQHIILKAKH